MPFLTSRTLRYFGRRAAGHGRSFANAGHACEERRGGRAGEEYCLRRGQHGKVVRSPHGANCTGCSFDVFVKGGIIAGGAQKTDYPIPHPDFPDYGPRGCPRGVSASWYVYSPLRVESPYIGGKLPDFWRDAKKAAADDPAAWRVVLGGMIGALLVRLAGKERVLN